MDKYIADLIGLAGLSLFGYGTWLLSHEAAYISVGIILMSSAYKMAKGK